MMTRAAPGRTGVASAIIALVAFAAAVCLSPRVASAQPSSRAAQRGQAVYDENCSNCHGPAGAGGVPNPGASRAADKKIPPLVGAAFQKRFPNAASMRSIIENGSEVPGSSDVITMPGWEDSLTPAQAADVSAYIVSLQPQPISTEKLASVAAIWVLVILTVLALYLRLDEEKAAPRRHMRPV